MINVQHYMQTSNPFMAYTRGMPTAMRNAVYRAVQQYRTDATQFNSVCPEELRESLWALCVAASLHYHWPWTFQPHTIPLDAEGQPTRVPESESVLAVKSLLRTDEIPIPYADPARNGQTAIQIAVQQRDRDIESVLRCAPVNAGGRLYVGAISRADHTTETVTITTRWFATLVQPNNVQYMWNGTTWQHESDGPVAETL